MAPERSRAAGAGIVGIAFTALSALLAACSGEIDSPRGDSPSGTDGTGADGGPGGEAAGGAPGASSAGGGPSSPPPAEPPPLDACRGPVPATFMAICNTCHTLSGAANSRYPDLYAFEGTFDEFTTRVRGGSDKGMAAYPPELVPDADLDAIFAYFKGGASRGDAVVDLGDVVPLFGPADAVNPAVVFERDDGVLVTRGAGRVRGRHEGPLDTNQPFMEFVEDYFVSRTYGFVVEDFTTVGESRIRVTYLPVAPPTEGTNFRAWKIYGDGDVFHANMGMESDVPLPSLALGGVDLTPSYETAVAPYARVQQQETTRNARTGEPIAPGDLFEFEFGIFNDAGAVEPPGSRTAYYSDTFRYRVGKGGLTADNPDPYTGGKGITGPTEAAQLGGATTNVWAYFMPETQFGQMALDVQHENVQAFVEGRRLFHTDFETGEHGEQGNAPFVEQAGKAGPLGTTASCETCHVNNGPGDTLSGSLGPETSMAFKLYDAGPRGAQLQPADGTASSAGASTTEVVLGDGARVTLSRPRFAVTMKDGEAPRYSARVARKVIGMGLLEAIDERTILGRADSGDCNGDSVSGRPNYVRDPRSGVLRVGRFGWKAEKVSVEHQVAEAIYDDMGVGTSLFPDSGQVELADTDLSKLVAYMRLVAVPGQRDGNGAQILAGERIFKTVGCANCHVTDVVTGAAHPFAELRTQSIKPYSDLLLHDMGPDLADESGVAPPEAPDARPAASEWRTPPLWGTGLLGAINGHDALLHDGRAASVLEAVLWHGGEAEATRDRVKALPAADRDALVAFVLSL